MTFIKFACRVVLAFALLGAGIAQADDTGVTEDTIKFGILGSLTGPAAIWGSGNLAGATLAFEQANEDGGIHGRKIEWVSVDDETSAPKGIAGFKRLVQSEEVFAVVGPTSSAVGVPMRDVLAESGVPILISIFSSPVMTDPVIPNVFRFSIINDGMQGRAIVNYLVEEEGFKKIALLKQSDQYGETGEQSALSRMKELDMEPVAVEVFNPSDTDFTSQILRVRSAEPDAIIVYGYPAPSAVVTRQIRELGIEAEIIGSSATSNLNYAETVGEQAVGVKVVMLHPELPESEEGPMAEFRAAYKERFPDMARQARPALSDFMGYAGALNIIEALRRAGPDLTRESFMAALETFDGFETGLTFPTYLSKDRHEGNYKASIAVIKDDLTREILPVEVSGE